MRENQLVSFQKISILDNKKNLFGAQSLESWAVWQQDIKSEWENFLLMRNRFLFVSKIHVWKWKAYLSFLSCCHHPVFVIRTQEAREWIGWRENPTRKLNLENLSIYLEKKLQQQEKAFLIIIQCTFLSLSCLHFPHTPTSLTSTILLVVYCALILFSLIVTFNVFAFTHLLLLH